MGNTPHEIKIGLQSLRKAKTIEELQRSYDNFLSKGYRAAKVKEAESIFLEKVEHFAKEIGYQGKDLFDIGLAKNPLAVVDEKAARWARLGAHKGEVSGLAEMEAEAARKIAENNARILNHAKREADILQAFTDLDMTEGAMRAAVQDGNYLQGQTGLNRALRNMEGRINGVPEYKLSMTEITDAVKALDKENGQSKSFIEIVKSTFAKIPKGVKWAAAGVALAGLATGAYLLIKNHIGKKSEKVEDVTKPVTEQGEVEQEASVEESDDVVIINPPAEESQEEDESEQVEEENTETEEPQDTEYTNNIYNVVKGDCIWKIAKRQLEEINGHKLDDVHNKEHIRMIIKRTNAIVEQNNLRWDSTHKKVLILPGQKLDISY